MINPLPDDRRFYVDAYSIMMCLLFLYTFSICLRHNMHRRRVEAPPAMHFMLQTNRKGLQKKLTSKGIQIYTSFQ